MTVYDGKKSYENGATLRIGDEVIVSPTKRFIVLDLEIDIRAIDGKGEAKFKLEYEVDGRTGVDCVYQDNIHAWMKP